MIRGNFFFPGGGGGGGGLRGGISLGVLFYEFHLSPFNFSSFFFFEFSPFMVVYHCLKFI